MVGFKIENFKSRPYIARKSGIGIPAVTTPSTGSDSTNQNQVKNENITFVNAYPNPATSTVTFSYSLQETVIQAELKIYELATGKYVKQVWLDKGEKQISVESLKPGMYAYTLLADGVSVSTKKLVIVK